VKYDATNAQGIQTGTGYRFKRSLASGDQKIHNRVLKLLCLQEIAKDIASEKSVEIS